MSGPIGLGAERPRSWSAPSWSRSRRGPAHARRERAGLPGIRRKDLQRRLRGDLDGIVLRALQKEPERRYSSAEALATDVRRHLRGLPVSARGDGVVYRACKFVRRHRVAVAAVLLVLLSMLGGLVGTAWQARRAQREARKAEAVKDFLKSVFSASDPAEAQGKELTARAAPRRRRAPHRDGAEGPARSAVGGRAPDCRDLPWARRARERARLAACRSRAASPPRRPAQRGGGGVPEDDGRRALRAGPIRRGRKDVRRSPRDPAQGARRPQPGGGGAALVPRVGERNPWRLCGRRGAESASPRPVRGDQGRRFPRGGPGPQQPRDHLHHADAPPRSGGHGRAGCGMGRAPRRPGPPGHPPRPFQLRLCTVDARADQRGVGDQRGRFDAAAASAGGPAHPPGPDPASAGARARRGRPLRRRAAPHRRGPGHPSRALRLPPIRRWRWTSPGRR